MTDVIQTLNIALDDRRADDRLDGSGFLTIQAADIDKDFLDVVLEYEALYATPFFPFPVVIDHNVEVSPGIPPEYRWIAQLDLGISSSEDNSNRINQISRDEEDYYSLHIPLEEFEFNDEGWVPGVTPEMFPLIELTHDDLYEIAIQVRGSMNIQDIYALSSMQEGILFHHLMDTEGDPYLVATQSSFDNRRILDQYLDAFQRVVDRHDILRTAFVWENISTPAQVVLHHAPISITEISLDLTDGPISEQLLAMFDPHHYRIDLTQAPLIQFVIAQEEDGHWAMIQLMHHLIDDQYTLDQIQVEIQAFIEGRGEELIMPLPFRNFIEQERAGPDIEAHKQFFTKILAGIDTPALLYGFSDVCHGSIDINESHEILPQDLNDRLRGNAKQLGTSLARICHLAWAQVVAGTSGQEKVVFGTVISRRRQAGLNGQALGPFINTLPICVDIGSTSVKESVHQIQTDIASLLAHEHASLTLAQCCSGLAPGMPLFNSLFNYRHNGSYLDCTSTIDGINVLNIKDQTNYPFAMTIDDRGNSLCLTAQVVKPFNATHICSYMQQALESLVYALEHTPNMPICKLDILPIEEHDLLLQTWNKTNMTYPDHLFVHQLFESQVDLSPDATAIVHEDQSLSYTTIVALMAILKSGGTYVPLDPSYPNDHLAFILEDSKPDILLVDEKGLIALNSTNLTSFKILDLNDITTISTINPQVPGLDKFHLAYVIYTSGSTGKPKGVMIEHQGLLNQILSRPGILGVGPDSRVLQFSSSSFDASLDEIFSALCYGGTLHVLPDYIRLNQEQMWSYIEKYSITHAELTPAVLLGCMSLRPLSKPLILILGGEALPPTLLHALKVIVPHGTIINSYGPTETTIDALTWKNSEDFKGDIVPIGRPIINKRVYVLDSHKKPVPIGAIGELYIAGAGVARGYLNRPELTDKAFLPDPFIADNQSRMYKTGDLVRYLTDGNVVFLRRNDYQVKIRGFRIELGEIEAHLVDHPIVREAVVLASGDGSNKHLVAYAIADSTDNFAHTLQSYLMSKLPEYMIPAAFVQLDAMPLTPTGKLDRKALPEPDSKAFVTKAYEAPQGEIECALANIWENLLKVDRVGRNDNFFMLGGHSLLVVRMIECLRNINLDLPVHALFNTPTLSALSKILKKDHIAISAPPNLITQGTSQITPDLLPLIDLNQDDIDTIVIQVHGGVSNIQDIYALSPLQE
ncbi:hypothetical protein BGX26_003450, partial [Mortierella sp. AD094]